MTVFPSRRGGGFKPLLLALALSAGLHTGPMLAQSAPAPQTVDIPAGSLARALDRLGEQTGVLITYEPGLVQGLDSPQVSGRLSPGDALRRLLDGTGIRVEAVNESTFVLRRAPAGNGTGSGAGGADAAREPAASETTEIGAILVTGSRLSRSSVEGPVPVNIYTSQEIERSGQTTVSGFLATLPEVSVATGEDGPVYAGQTSVRLRGLPLGSTLVLINGRRLQNGGATAGYGSYVDLNSIPAAAIERIEVVPEGSSAVYGSDALAGVVNIILRQDFDGFQGNLRYGAASGIDESAADMALGRSGERGGWSVIASYFSRGSLDGMERDSTRTIRERSVEYCNPGNVYSVDGGPLPGLDAPSAGVRPGTHGAPTLGDFDPGRPNACSQSYDKASIPSTERASVFASGRYRVAPWMELFAELAYTHQSQDLDHGGRSLLSTRVPASNAFNPFGTDVLASYRFDSPLASIVMRNRAEFTRPLVGVRGDFGGEWDWEFAAWDARDRSAIHQSGMRLDPARLAAALASSDPATALNLFTGGAPASDAVLGAIYGPDRVRMSGRSQVANAFLRGPLVMLPSGPVDIVLGAEYVRSELAWSSADNPADTANFSRARETGSVFSEVRVPLLGPRAGSVADVLAFSGAVRHDAYNDIGSRLTPQYALEWRPLDTLLVRGAYSESFKAPGLVYLHYPVSAFADCCTVLDPRDGGATTTYTFVRQGNPDLEPESGDSRSAGVVWSPRALPGLEASLTWWEIEQIDRVAELPPQSVVDNEELFPGRVVRDPATGRIVSVSGGFLNFGRMRVSGLDLGLGHRIDTDAGVFSPRLGVTWIDRYEAGVAPGAPLSDRVGRADADAWAPEWKAVASLGWERGPYSVNVAGRYVSGYTDYQDLGPTSRRLGDFWLFDASARYDVGRVFAGDNRYLRETFVQLNVVNLLDSLPDVYSAYNGGSKSYDPMQYDIRGRFVSATLGLRF